MESINLIYSKAIKRNSMWNRLKMKMKPNPRKRHEKKWFAQNDLNSDLMKYRIIFYYYSSASASSSAVGHACAYLSKTIGVKHDLDRWTCSNFNIDFYLLDSAAHSLCHFGWACRHKWKIVCFISMNMRKQHKKLLRRFWLFSALLAKVKTES